MGNKESRESTTITCPKCTLANKKDAFQCEVCGERLGQIPGECPTCTFAGNDPSALQCSVCATPLQQEDDGSDTKELDPKKIAATQALLSKHAKAIKGDEKSTPPVFASAAFRALPNISEDVKTSLTVSYKEASTLLDTYSEVKSMRDRTKTRPVKEFMLSTLTQGLPLFARKPQINKEVKMCMGYVMFKIFHHKNAQRRKDLMIELADAFTACQAVQQRVIYTMFAKLANVELDFQQQVFKALSQFKHRCLDKAVCAGIGTGADPHWRSACHVAVWDDLGVQVDGLEAATLDKDIRHLNGSARKKVIGLFVGYFNANEFILEFLQDVNQTSTKKRKKGEGDDLTLSRNFGLQKLYQWAAEQDKGTFDPHSIFYDDAHPHDYLAAQAKDQRSYVPYLSPKIARKILRLLGVTT
mmetsp:Transcript_19028/g.36829  ORF Transcript_19028/g.36829 Transcript_19028/m.36829 type:complete len:413 (+) Transcript_19028:84-1322(+)